MANWKCCWRRFSSALLVLFQNLFEWIGTVWFFVERMWWVLKDNGNLVEFSRELSLHFYVFNYIISKSIEVNLEAFIIEQCWYYYVKVSGSRSGRWRLSIFDVWCPSADSRKPIFHSLVCDVGITVVLQLLLQAALCVSVHPPVRPVCWQAGWNVFLWRWTRAIIVISHFGRVHMVRSVCFSLSIYQSFFLYFFLLYSIRLAHTCSRVV